tara:strand:+ start:1113 stop:1220 length:108 start_codon:yes stop_codon:yes gene_type:complete
MYKLIKIDSNLKILNYPERWGKKDPMFYIKGKNRI